MACDGMLFLSDKDGFNFLKNLEHFPHPFKSRISYILKYKYYSKIHYKYI